MILFECAVLILSTIAVFAQNENINRYESMIDQWIEESEEFEPPTDANSYRPSTSEINDIEDVDFVIVGAGAAGSVLANRLSEIKNWKILVLEAGTFGNDFTDIPAMSPYVQESNFNWGYRSIPQTTACLGLLDERCLCPRGKAFGGTTILNGLRYVRGNKEDFNLWEAHGNPGWSYDYVLPYFIKSENTSSQNVDTEYHGYSGPMHNENFKPFTQKLQRIIQAHNEMGFDAVDYNGLNQIGVSRAQLNSLEGKRVSAYKGYIKPVMHRINLKLLPNALVTKILIDKNTKSAEGIIFANNDQYFRVKAKKEIILSAGTIGSPQILMLSGIGPANHLQEMDIEVLEDLPVGHNLIDHPMFSGIYFNTDLKDLKKTRREYIKEYLSGYGPYTLATMTEGVGFYYSKYSNSSTGPDIELYFLPPNPGVSLSKKITGYTDETFQAYYENLDKLGNIQMRVICLHPNSRGSVKLTSNDPFDYPAVDINFYSDVDNHDVNVVLSGIKLAIEIFSRNALESVGATLGKVDLPACREYEYLSDDYWKCMMRYFTFYGHHLVGTCKMGPRAGSGSHFGGGSDSAGRSYSERGPDSVGEAPTSGGVVDSHLRVHGIRKLRVVDASVIERISGHTSAPTSMIAEKISDVIKLQNGVKLEELDPEVLGSEVLFEFLRNIADASGFE